MLDEAIRNAVTEPSRLWSRGEVFARPCPIPATAGVYGWFFRTVPLGIDSSDCVRWRELVLLYVGISPKAPPASGGRPSKQNLRSRIRSHLRGNSSTSTLRLTLGTLLDIPLQRVGNDRLTFGEGEARLSAWMEENAFVAWVATSAPWEAEEELMGELDLPLNLDGNRGNRFWAELTRRRSEARAAARGTGR